MTRVVKARTATPAQVAEALSRGGVIVPVLRGYGVIGLDREELSRKVGRACRLVGSAADVPVPAGVQARAGLERLLALGAVVVVDRESPGYVVPPDGLAREVVRAAGGPVWLALPEEGSGLSELMDELGDWAALAVAGQGPAGPGPTVVDLTQEPVLVDRRGEPAILELERELGGLVRLGREVFFSVLVVCTGNSCRSPMAAGILSRMLAGERVLVGSAGTNAPDGAPATRFALGVAAENGADISAHRARQVAPEMVRAADLILVMERYHRDWIAERVPEAGVKVRLLAGYPHGEEEIADPVGRSLEFYRETALLLKAGLMRAAAEIRRRLR